MEKSPQLWGLRPQPPVGLRQLGASPPVPQVVTPVTCSSYFKIMTYYLILEIRLVGPLTKLAPLPWLNPLVTPLVSIIIKSRAFFSKQNSTIHG